MTYSVDLRKKVVGFVRNGGGQREAARRFEVSLWCVRDWLARKDLQPQQKGVPRQRKLDKEALRAPVRANPDALLRERAAHFGVRISSLEAALKRLRITRKKKDAEIQGTPSRKANRLFSATAPDDHGAWFGKPRLCRRIRL